MLGTDFILRYLPFWILNYALAVVVWSCIGRFMLGFFVPQMQPQNYIWRAFYWLSQWAVWLCGFITPAAVRPVLMPLVAAFWLFHLRLFIYLVLVAYGLAPRLGEAVGVQ